MKAIILSLAALFIMVSCTETIDKKLNSETFIADLNEIRGKYSKDYQDKDFEGLVMGVGVSKLMGFEKQIGQITYRQLLDRVKQEREEKERARLVELKMYENELRIWSEHQAELDKIVSFSILGKQHHQDDFGIRGQQMFKYSLQNNGSKNIKAVKGGFFVYDSFGEVVGRYGIEWEKPIAAGKSVNEDIYYDFNSYDSDNVKVKNVELKDLEYEWMTDMVIFSDGSVMESREEPVKPESAIE